MLTLNDFVHEAPTCSTCRQPQEDVYYHDCFGEQRCIECDDPCPGCYDGGYDAQPNA